MLSIFKKKKEPTVDQDYIQLLEQQLEEAKLIINEERNNYFATSIALTEFAKLAQEKEEKLRVRMNALLLRLGDQCEASPNIVELASDPAVSVQVEDTQDGGMVFRLTHEEEEHAQ